MSDERDDTKQELSEALARYVDARILLAGIPRSHTNRHSDAAFDAKFADAVLNEALSARVTQLIAEQVGEVAETDDEYPVGGGW